jgi:hypothetical protein
MKRFNKLTPSQDERLALLLEEMGEAIQVIGKIKRHGFDSAHPDNLEITNRMLLEKELGHVRHSMIRLCESGDLSKTEIHKAADMKRMNVWRYLHHQDD